ncbi:MAG: MFS transporter [Betaproteobacteria bacterium]|nr:MFS transporter [Betaproteobacteria bacterium]
MYDFANSGYTTVVITAIFSAYFVKSVAGNLTWATLAWTLGLAVSYLLVLVTAPVIGAYADLHGKKKLFLGVTTIGCVVSTAMLATVGPGDLWLALVFLVASNFFFGTGEDLVAAFLPELGKRAALGRISAWGWSLGYLGGLLSLGLCLAYVAAAQAKGEAASSFVPVTMLITAALFAIAALPTFVFLRERAEPNHTKVLQINSFGRLVETWRSARRFQDLGRFLVCIVFYQAGVQAVVALAAVYAEQAMGFSTSQTITLILLVNIAAAMGAFAFGHVQDWLGHRPTIAATIVGWMITIVLSWLATSAELFWVAATLAGICLGSSQSGGRALVGLLSPKDRVGEFFGLWGMAMKLAAILGPVTYGGVVWLAADDHRTAILTTGVFFVVGLALLFTIDIDRGRKAAGASD